MLVFDQLTKTQRLKMVVRIQINAFANGVDSQLFLRGMNELQRAARDEHSPGIPLEC